MIYLHRLHLITFYLLRILSNCNETTCLSENPICKTIEKRPIICRRKSVSLIRIDNSNMLILVLQLWETLPCHCLAVIFIQRSSAAVAVWQYDNRQWSACNSIDVTRCCVCVTRIRRLKRMSNIHSMQKMRSLVDIAESERRRTSRCVMMSGLVR